MVYFRRNFEIAPVVITEARDGAGDLVRIVPIQQFRQRIAFEVKAEIVKRVSAEFLPSNVNVRG